MKSEGFSLFWLSMISFLFRRGFSFQSPHRRRIRAFTPQVSTLLYHGPRVPARPSSFLAVSLKEESSIVENRAFEVTAKYSPTGDQPQAIRELTKRMKEGDKFSVLKGITGTGKTFVMSHVIANLGKPTLVLCHNKTLAAQLARELRSFLKNNAVELFVSYYNHYVPESFVETTGKYIAKKSSVNSDIDALRHRATRALMTRRDVVVVASVSCIYGLGLPKEYLEASMELCVDDRVTWDEMIGKLDGMLYEHEINDDAFSRGHYQLSEGVSNGKNTRIINVWLPHEKFPMQIELEEQSNEFRVAAIREGSQGGLVSVPFARIFPAKHHVTSAERLESACLAIEDELRVRTKELLDEGKLVEADRLQNRVSNDLMILRETGFCSGGENYSRHFAGRSAGEPPDTLMDYLGLHGDWLLMVDESHVTLPQLKAMYGGDQARKRLLVKHGYRLPSALDNRPLQEKEFWDQVDQTLFVSATPSSREIELTERTPVEMEIRPTYVCDPDIEVRSRDGQLEDLLGEIQQRVERKQRTLVITLTKRDAEDLSNFLNERGFRSTYIHSGLKTNERSNALRALQSGEVEVLVGINCLREGLDLPQVSLVAVLNADSEGFLRSETALLQIVGRAARNKEGKAIFYANRVTGAMDRCIDETKRRRERQLAYNEENGFEMKSTRGSSMMSIFDLLKDQIEAEQELDLMRKPKDGVTKDFSVGVDLKAVVPILLNKGTNGETKIATDHVPSSPGVYFWRDEAGKILYIGKAVKLRSRVRSYLAPNAKHSARIRTMIQKATSVDFVLTPSERDALILESNLIKHHQPPFNVLLKDDTHYPYLCASLGDKIPRLSIVPRRASGLTANDKHRYFGPYTSFREINEVLERVEAKYDLRSKSFLVRHGSLTAEDYLKDFHEALDHVFSETRSLVESNLRAKRSEYEEAQYLFDSPINRCRDVVSIGISEDESKGVVVVVQLRDGIVGGVFSYSVESASGFEDEGDAIAAIENVLIRQHYPSGEESLDIKLSWFPDEILLPTKPLNAKGIRDTVREARQFIEPERKGTVSILTASKSGQRKQADERALDFAGKNAQQKALELWLGSRNGSTISSVDGNASSQLQEMLQLDSPPNRIECYDISHTQGDYPVASRVVFVDGVPAPHLYRRFNIKTVEGIDDYASIEEVLERRFRRLDSDASGDDSWTKPDLVVIDGGPGQLNAAIRGMGKANVFPLEGEADDLNRVGICSLAKNQEEVFVVGRKDPVNDSADSAALLLLRSIRDESHRFALKSHRQRRSITKQQ